VIRDILLVLRVRAGSALEKKGDLLWILVKTTLMRTDIRH
jgi:hypothetical protein